MRTHRLLGSIAAVATIGLVYACSGDDSNVPENAVDAGGGADVTTADVTTPPPIDATPVTDTGIADAGAPDTSDSAVPADAADAASPNTVLQLALGGDHSCALLASGDVWCWGGNYDAQQGTGAFDNLAHAPAKVAGLPASVAIAAGDHHTCALDTLGVVRCWGSNQIMQLGHDNTLDAAASDAGEAGVDLLCSAGIPCSPTPRVVTGLGAAKAIAANLFDNCARLVTGEVQCWGLNKGSGFLGHPGPDLQCFFGTACNFNPSTVTGVTDGPIIVGAEVGCALTSNAVSCWGSNIASELATDADTNPHSTPVSIGGLPAISAIRAGGGSQFAIGPAGALYGWGSDTAGELGDGCDASTSVAPRLVVEGGVIDAVGGGAFGCALSSAGIVSCWGSDSHGPLGRGIDAGTTCNLAAPVTGLANVTKIGVGLYHVCALKTDNSVWCWGYDQNGQLGHDPTTDPPCTGGRCNTTPAKVVGLP